MPRGHKSKLRAREKRRQARSGSQGLEGAQAAATEVEESTSSPVSGAAPLSSSAAGTSQEPQKGQATAKPAGRASRRRSKAGAKSQVKESKNSSQASTSAEKVRNDPLTRRVGMLMEFLLEKHNMKEPIMRASMLKIVTRRFKEHFPEILKRASEHLELVFGLELKEVKPNGLAYTLVSILDTTGDGSVSIGSGLPRSGLLIPLLGVIFLSGNQASEEDVWEFLNILGVYDGRKHSIFGDPRKLITQDLVQEKYLEYRQVPNSNPPRYEFLWGQRAHAETSKMKILEFLAKVHDTVPSAFPYHYAEALRDEEERARVRAASGRSAPP
ncbi:melanoma-associated antigen B1-like [Lynx rufus]|uniref:melanoma-associated antigen B1-like n=1 Tax=Lynx rufus TaxID=61384 RepID=UPI001F122DB2|nr:melanoma-associated antigen B1-like [Lynx rufus]